MNYYHIKQPWDQIPQPYTCNCWLAILHMLLICSENFTSNPNEACCHGEFINTGSSFLSSFTNKEILEGNENSCYLNLGIFINP